MSKIDLKQFVDINIIAKEVNSVSNIRDTVVLYTAEAHVPIGSPDTFTGIISSLSEAEKFFPSEGTNAKPVTNGYLKMFFNNGGIKVKIEEVDNLTDISADEFKSLDNEYICISCAAKDDEVSDGENVMNVTNTYAKLIDIANTLATDSSVYGINEKLIIARTSTLPSINVSTHSDNLRTKNLVVKYSDQLGGEMTISAYLSKINVYKINSVFDYAFTEETINSQDITDANFKDLMSNYYNIDINLANAIRNCGGNCKNGQDLVNTYVKIILHQTLTDALINLLSQKIKGSDGISKIYATMSQELEKYLNCGYLTTDKIWTYDDYVITRNNVEYTIIEKGTPLIKGYLIKILPLSSLTDAEKAEHSTPPIYVIIADQYGIRKITINGEVI